jgi:GTP cyclohydrolase II
MSCCASNPSPDLALVDLLSQSSLGSDKKFADLEPLMLAAVFASGRNMTRNHYAHGFNTQVSALAEPSVREPQPSPYTSRQAPRRQRLQLSPQAPDKENHANPDPLQSTSNLPSKKRRSSVISHADPPSSTKHSEDTTAPPHLPVVSDLEVVCMARTRIPTPHGPAFLHLYHNNRDTKEHLAIVIDPVQLSQDTPTFTRPIRSQSLDAVWAEDESDMDRITRGAYVGTLTPSSQHPSSPPQHIPSSRATHSVPPPLIRIHSECFTGETIGSMRCDCGEQLDEALRLISQPITLPSHTPGLPTVTIPGRGAVIYLRQEGRGIGLLSKIRAYNLQDLGHDTVTANLMLGHKADERGYEIAAAIARDLGLGTDAERGVRLLTNNPDKVRALEQEGVRITERVPMVPRSWQARLHPDPLQVAELRAEEEEAPAKIAGATLVGGNAVHGQDLDKYMRTKVLRMGHMLPLYLDGVVNH